MDRNAEVALYFVATAANGETALCWVSFNHTHSYYIPTCTTPAKCSCGETTGDKDPSNHTGGTEIRNAVEATYDEMGYTGDTYCKGCGVQLESGKDIPMKGYVPVRIDDDAVVKDVTFKPIKGITIPDDAEVIVKDHTATIKPVKSIVGLKIGTEYITVADDDITVSNSSVVLNGVTFYEYEIVVINGEEFVVVDTDNDRIKLQRFSDGAAFYYDGENLIYNELFDIICMMEKRDDQRLNINGITYDVVAVLDGFSSLDVLNLYYDGHPAGQYSSTTGTARFIEGFDPATLKAQQDNIFLGTVTIPEIDTGSKTRAQLVAELEAAEKAVGDYYAANGRDSQELVFAWIDAFNALAEFDAIRQLAMNKTYRAYAIGANEISMKNATAVSGTITQTFEVPAEYVNNPKIKFVALHVTNPFESDHNAAMEKYEDAVDRYRQAEKNGATEEELEQLEKERRDAYSKWMEVQTKWNDWEKENASDAYDHGTVTVAEDGKTVTATYAVDSFSPFIVYALGSRRVGDQNAFCNHR